MAVIPDGPFIGAVFSHDGGALRSSPLDCASVAAVRF